MTVPLAACKFDQKEYSEFFCCCTGLGGGYSTKEAIGNFFLRAL